MRHTGVEMYTMYAMGALMAAFGIFYICTVPSSLRRGLRWSAAAGVVGGASTIIWAVLCVTGVRGHTWILFATLIPVTLYVLVRARRELRPNGRSLAELFPTFFGRRRRKD